MKSQESANHLGNYGSNKAIPTQHKKNNIYEDDTRKGHYLITGKTT